jgi:hypothetical protein
LNEVLTNPSAGLPNEFAWLSNFVTGRADAGDFVDLTSVLLRAVFTMTVLVWEDHIGKNPVKTGYTGKIDLDTAISGRQASASEFLKAFRGDIRANTIENLLVVYTNSMWDTAQRVSFNILVVEPIVLQCVYNAHCRLLDIPATFDDVLSGRSEEELMFHYCEWKNSRTTKLMVLNLMLKTYCLAGYCVYRRLSAVCTSGRSYNLNTVAHEVR